MRGAWIRARRVMEDSDVVLEVLDARDPGATRNPLVERTAEAMGKRLLAVMNKADLAERKNLEAWLRRFADEGIRAVYVSAKFRMGTRGLMASIRDMAPRIPVRVAVVGYPNVGKSTIINYLKGRHAAPTSPVPGWTRGEQIVRAKAWLVVIDTPGIVMADEEDPALMVIRGLVDPGRVDDPVPYAYALLRRVLEYNPRALVEAYGIEADVEAALDAIARARGRLARGGRPNVEEAARTVIKDWIRGRLRYSRPP